jgi:hypothetical protein
LRAISAPSGFAAIAVNQSADDRLRLTMPEYMMNAPSAPARVARLDPGGVRQREGNRVEDARSRGVARKGRRDHRVEQEDRIREPSVDRPNTLTMR